MKKTQCLFGVTLLLLSMVSACNKIPPHTSSKTLQQTPTEQQATKRLASIKSLLLDRLKAQRHALERMDSLAAIIHITKAHQPLQESFHEARNSFKRTEWAVEYFASGTAHELNGPPIDEYEPVDGVVIPATGYQVLEASLFPSVIVRDSVSIRTNIRIMGTLLTRAEKVFAAQEFTDAHIFDALWLEVARVQTLGITGFDAPICLTAIHDATLALTSLGEMLEVYHNDTTKNEWQSLHTYLKGAILFCSEHTDFDSFDRAEWFIRWMNPLAASIKEFQNSLSIAPLNFSNAFQSHARTVFDSAAFNVLHFAPLASRNLTNEASQEQRQARIDLGRQLFYDPLLSGDSSRSCATCHKPELAFTDGLAHSKAFSSGGRLKRNAPTLLNAALQTALFADLRTTFLEDQAKDVVQNTDEMHGSLAHAALTLRSNESYRKAFVRAFGGTDLSAITEEAITSAIASYERTLVSMNSPFDRFMRGDTSALTIKEKHGFSLYMGKAKCGTCHFAPLFNGTVPPSYVRTEQEVIGVPVRAVAAHATIDDDIGRFVITKYEKHRYGFKTPTLRNVALTAPYMHNGAYTTLEKVIDFYNRGGGKGIGIANLEHQTLAPDPLRLTSDEQRDLIAFLRSLTDTNVIHTHAQ